MGALTEPAARFAALAVATPVRAFFETADASARVLASFERSAYVETEEGQLIAILAESLGRGAFALTVAGAPDLGTLPPRTPVRVEDRGLHLAGLTIDLTSAAPWDPTLPGLARDAGEGMRSLERHLQAHAPEDGLSRAIFEPDRPAGPADAPLMITRGRAALSQFRTTLLRSDASGLTAAVASLAGLGPGLTPSGDDLLAGVLLALRLWPAAARPLGPDVVGALILGAAVPRTGRISRAYLWAARQGHAADGWHALVRALPGPPDDVAAAATRILQTGETSGADMLAGFLFGWRLRGRE